jgi:hypothetical protein
MPAEANRAPLSVYMLADHLDAALAAGEDLVARGADWRILADAPGNMQTFAERQRTIVEDVRGLELMLMARIIKSRDHARALAQADPRFGAVANLFVSGTAILMDAIGECSDATAEDFNTGDGLIAYVRGRGLIAPDAASVSHASQLTIDDNFLVAKRAALGPLMDMAAAFLDALEAHYDLFGEHKPAEAAPEIDTANDAQSYASAIAYEQEAEDPEPITASPASPISAHGGAPRKEFGRRDRMPIN